MTNWLIEKWEEFLPDEELEVHRIQQLHFVESWSERGGRDSEGEYQLGRVGGGFSRVDDLGYVVCQGHVLPDPRWPDSFRYRRRVGSIFQNALSEFPTWEQQQVVVAAGIAGHCMRQYADALFGGEIRLNPETESYVITPRQDNTWTVWLRIDGVEVQFDFASMDDVFAPSHNWPRWMNDRSNLEHQYSKWLKEADDQAAAELRFQHLQQLRKQALVDFGDESLALTDAELEDLYS